MKRLVIVYRDKDLSQFKSPVVTNATDEKELVSDVTAGLSKYYKPEQANLFIAHELYSVGIYDDQTGCIEAHVPQMLLDCDEILIKRKEFEAKHKEVEING